MRDSVSGGMQDGLRLPAGGMTGKECRKDAVSPDRVPEKKRKKDPETISMETVRGMEEISEPALPPALWIGQILMGPVCCRQNYRFASLRIFARTGSASGLFR